MPDEYSGNRSGRGGSRDYDIHDAEEFDLQLLSGLKFRLTSDTTADLNEAENAIWDLNNRKFGVDQAVCSDAMLNVEAMASVRMDGRQPNAREIFFQLADTEVRGSEEPDHLVRYRRDRASLEYALGLSSAACSVETFRKIHERVLPPRHEGAGGKLRTDLKQVGGSRYHSFGSVYTMPSPDKVGPLLEDLASFINSTTMIVVEQAALAHAQLVNIHPFERGNGKMARAVVHFVFSYRGIAPRYLLPITPVIVTSNHDYIAGINACQMDGSEPEGVLADNMNAWLSYFSTSCLKAANITVDFMVACEEALAAYEQKVKLRKGSAARLIMESLPAMPVFSAQMAADRVGCSFKRASEACKQLKEAGVLHLVAEVKRNRIYYSDEVLNAYMQIDALR